MRILMLAHRIPYPPYTGDKVRAYHIARHLARQHDLTLAFLVDDPEDWAGLDPLREEIGELEFAGIWKPWQLIKGAVGLACGRPVTLPCFASGSLHRRLTHRLSLTDYDLIYVSSSSMAQYVDGHGAAPLVMDFVDVDSDKWTQYSQKCRPPISWLYRIEGERLRRYEAKVARTARLCVLATPAEEALLKSFAPWAKTSVIPNGIDLNYYTPNGRTAAGPTLIFTGAMDYLPNIDAVNFFCSEIYPRVQRELPEVRFFIVGLNPSRAVLRLSRQSGVVITGAVPDVRPFYGRASVFVAPLRIARGVQNKVLQAMAMGLPVVATPCATSGIRAQAERDLIIEEDPGLFAARVLDLLRKPGERAALGQRGRAFVETHHSWDASLSNLDGLLQLVVTSPATPMGSST